MKILIIHEIDWIKKVPFEPHHLAEIFSTKGHDVFVIDCEEPNFGHLLSGLHVNTINNYHRLYKNSSITLIRPSSFLIKGLNRLSHFLTCKKTIKNILIQNNIDIILLYGIATNGIQCIQAAKELNIPIIFRSLDIAHKLVRIPILQQITKKYEKNVIKNATKVLATTPTLTKYTENMGAKKEKTEYFPLGVNSKKFNMSKRDNDLALSLGINPEDKVILFMGTIYPFAGLEKIINNFGNLNTKIKSIKFLIIGGGPDLNNIRNLVQKNNLNSKIIFTGFLPQNDIPKYIALSDLCISPFDINSVTDKIIPTKILEYLACGKPVLSTPLQGTKELLPNENYGIFYANSENFIERIVTLLNDQKSLELFGNLGYEYVQKNHNWDVLSDKLLNLFQILISKKSSNY